ncbi:DsbA family oxidoreductase [Flavobacteriaceae bacterium F08102]|nr:DsbA family oxidoreductase [Flavobacteriaceae bacterium F08102]
MKTKIKIDIVSDVVCPWCTIGYKRLEKAIDELGLQDRIIMEWHPFELNPHMPPEGETILAHLSAKYGSTLEEQKKSQKLLTQYGAEVGFTFNYFDEMRIVNTFDAHVLLAYANEKGKQTELAMRLVTAYNTEGKDVSDREVLKAEIASVGLDPKEAMQRLEDDDARYTVKSNEALWQRRGVTSVPTIVFNDKMAVTGAQPVTVFKEVLSELMEDVAD